jgi:hypothetical protein
MKKKLIEAYAVIDAKTGIKVLLVQDKRNPKKFIKQDIILEFEVAEKITEKSS